MASCVAVIVTYLIFGATVPYFHPRKRRAKPAAPAPRPALNAAAAKSRRPYTRLQGGGPWTTDTLAPCVEVIVIYSIFEAAAPCLHPQHRLAKLVAPVLSPELDAAPADRRGPRE